MNSISQFFLVATIVWSTLGIIGFSWLYVGRIRRAIRWTKDALKRLGKTLQSWGRILVEACLLLGLFLIPVVIIFLNWFFNPV